MGEYRNRARYGNLKNSLFIKQDASTAFCSRLNSEDKDGLFAPVDDLPVDEPGVAATEAVPGHRVQHVGHHGLASVADHRGLAEVALDHVHLWKWFN